MKSVQKIISLAILFLVLSSAVFVLNKLGFSDNLIQTASAQMESIIFDTAGEHTFTVPDIHGEGIRVEAWGGGGGGGSGPGNSAAAGGGGGAYGEAYFSVESGIEYEVVVGSGGSVSDPYDGASGGLGEETVFRSSENPESMFLSVEGGEGGRGGHDCSSGRCSGGAGGSIVLTGTDGGDLSSSNEGEDGENSGPSDPGAGGDGADDSVGNPGGTGGAPLTDGESPGGGGGGGSRGGVGASGKVIIHWEKMPVCGDGIVSGDEVCDRNGNIGCDDPARPFCNMRCTFCVCSDSRLVFLDKPIICIITDIILFLLSIIGGIALLMIILSGIFYIFSGANPDAQNKAKKTFNFAIIGIILVLISYAIILILNGLLVE